MKLGKLSLESNALLFRVAVRRMYGPVFWAKEIPDRGRPILLARLAVDNLGTCGRLLRRVTPPPHASVTTELETWQICPRRCGAAIAVRVAALLSGIPFPSVPVWVGMRWQEHDTLG